ncbi:MAG: tetratricopeptide repeat protein [Planctomycetaceae bacterium]|nr:tetratricopeptide repeat protein [Planctomycetaceae bacterium]
MKTNRAMPQVWMLLGVCDLQEGNLAEAERCFREALRLAPAQPLVKTQLARVLIESDRGVEAEALCREVLQKDPWNHDASQILVTALQRQGRLTEAIDVASHIVSRRPDCPGSLSQLGELLTAAGRLHDAHSTFVKARSLNSGLPHLHLQLSSVQGKLGRHDEALESLEQACRLNPEITNQLAARGNLYLEANRPLAAMKEFQQLVEEHPDYAPGLNGLGRSLLSLGYWNEALEAFRLAAVQDNEQRSYDSNFLYCATLSPNVSRAEAAHLHLAWGDSVASSTTPRQHVAGNDPHRTLRIGYVSGDIRDHAAMKFFLPLLRRHSHEQFQILLYSTSAITDAVTLEARALADHWRMCQPLSAQDLAALIIADQVDILVDMSGHTAGNRLRVFATRPAPIQVSFMGYPNTTGLHTMDYRLTDAVREDDVSATFFSEQLIAMPHGGSCFEMRGDAPPVNEPPSISNGHITFGATHRLEKISTDSLRLWAAILNNVPGARLLIARDTLSDQHQRQQLLQRMTAVGIPAECIRTEWDLQENHLKIYSAIDILLDVFPWGSSTTAFESMWMGVPIPSIRQPTRVSSVVASLLASSGHGNLVASTESEYVHIVSELARDARRLYQLRSELRSSMKDTVCNAAQFATDIEVLYRRMWQRHCGLSVELPVIQRRLPEE